MPIKRAYSTDTTLELRERIAEDLPGVIHELRYRTKKAAVALADELGVECGQEKADKPVKAAPAKAEKPAKPAKTEAQLRLTALGRKALEWEQVEGDCNFVRAKASAHVAGRELLEEFGFDIDPDLVESTVRTRARSKGWVFGALPA